MSFTCKEPKLRFPEFSGEWVEKRLSQIIDFKSGYAFPSSNMSSEVQQYQLIKMSNVYQNILALDRSPSYWQKINKSESEFLLNQGDVILTLTGTVGKRDYGYSIMIQENNKFLLNQRLVRLRAIEEISISKFIRNLVLHERFLYNFFINSKGGTGNQSNVSIEDLKQIKLPLPSKPEQEKIASFLTAVDAKIEQLTCKEKLLEKYKKSAMQKLFSQELRFTCNDGSGFSEWRYVQLNKILSESKKRNFDKKFNKNDVLSVSGAHGIVNQIELQGRSFAGASVDNYHVVEIDDIVYTKSPLKSNPYGIIKANMFKAGIVSTLYAVYKPHANLNSRYLDYYFQKDINTNNYLRPLVHKGAKNDMKINNLHVLSGYISIPSLPEQTKIANFLSSIDEKCLHVKHQLAQTQKFKKALLQQMFV